MDQQLQLVVELCECTWSGFKGSLEEVTPEEANWRPLPEANHINLILRHLRFDAAEHLENLEHSGPSVLPPAASLPLDFERNLKELEDLFTKFVAGLRQKSLADIQQQTALVYQKSSPRRGSRPPHFLAYHQVLHLAMHWGQICTIRNLYKKTRGEPARFFPVNRSFPA